LWYLSEFLRESGGSFLNRRGISPPAAIGAEKNDCNLGEFWPQSAAVIIVAVRREKSQAFVGTKGLFTSGETQCSRGSFCGGVMGGRKIVRKWGKGASKNDWGRNLFGQLERVQGSDSWPD